MLAAVETSKSEERGEEKKSVMVVGVDDSDVSFYALQWTLDHFFSPPNLKNNDINFKLVIVHAKPSPSSVVSLAGPGAVDVVPYVESDLRKKATRVLQKAKELCAAHSVGDVLLEVVEGDARNVLCEAVEKHHADMLVVGSHGYGAIKRERERLLRSSCTLQRDDSEEAQAEAQTLILSHHEY